MAQSLWRKVFGTKQQAMEQRRAQQLRRRASLNRLALERLEDRTTPTVGPLGAQAQLAQAYGQLPLSFEANAGQTDSHVQFLSRGEGYSLALTPSGAFLNLNKAGGQADTASSALQISLIGGNPLTSVKGVDRLPGVTNYLVGKDPSQWRTNIANYSRVEYQNAYPGIDLVYYGNQQQLEYDFIVAPRVDPGAIRFAIRGADDMHLDDQGNLVVQVNNGELIQRAPILYQEVGGTRQPVAGKFVLFGEDTIGFQVGSYNQSLPLTIDPILSYSTYLGGALSDAAAGIAVDSSGNAYVVGTTFSSNFSTINGSLQTTTGGANDVFVTKLTADGSALAYSTYLGGSSDDQGFAITLDGSGNAYVVGTTSSINFPTTGGAFQTSLGSATFSDAFVAKLNATGTALVYSTYLGGASNDKAVSIAVDTAGNAYVAGSASSINFPTTPGAFQPSSTSGGSFVTKLNASGTALAYSTYLSGTQYSYDYHPLDGAAGIAVDSTGNAFVVGSTSFTDFPTTQGAYRTSLEGVTNAYVVKLNASGSSPIYSTLLGNGYALGNANGYDFGNAIAIDGTGAAVVVGYTGSNLFSTTNGAFQTQAGGYDDAYVRKLSPDGSSLVFSTYLGGTGNDYGSAVALDSAGNAYVIGSTSASSFPTTPDAYQSTMTGYSAVFFSKLDAAGTTLNYGTLLGGNGSSSGYGIALDSSNHPYLVGYTGSSDFPTTNNAYQTTNGGGGDAFIAKLILPVPPTIASVANNGPIAQGNAVTVTVTASDPDGSGASLQYDFDFNNDGEYEVSNTLGYATNTFAYAGDYTVNVRVRDVDGASATASTTVIVGTSSDNITLGGYLLTNVVTSNGKLAGDTTLPLAGSVRIAGTYVDSSHFSLSAPVPGLSLAGFSLANAVITLSDTGLGLAGDASVPGGKTAHLTGTVQDATHYSLTASISGMTLAGFVLTNAVVTMSNGSVGLKGDAALPVVGNVHLEGSIQDASHFSLTVTVPSLTVAGFSLTGTVVTLNDAGLKLASNANLPLVGNVHLEGAIQDASHYSFQAPVTGLSISSFSFSNTAVTLSADGLSLAGNTSLPLVGAVHLEGEIQDASHYEFSASVPNLTLAGFTVSQVVVDLSPDGVGLIGDANLPLVGNVHLEGTIQDASHYSLSVAVPDVSIAGFTLSSAVVTLNETGVSLAGNATLPIVGTVHLGGSILDASNFKLSVPVPDVTLAGFSLTQVVATLTAGGFGLKGNATLPLVGSIQNLEGLVESATNFSLSVPLPSVAIGSFTLSDNSITLSAVGVSLTGHANLAVIGPVTFTGNIFTDGTFSITATPQPMELLGGLVKFTQQTYTLTTEKVSVEADAEVLQIGQAHFTGSIYFNGNYELGATITVSLAGFSIEGASLKFGSDKLDVDFMLPVPEIGDVSFRGSYGPGGHWSVGATYPGPVQVGPVTLTDIGFDVSDTSLKLFATGSVADLQSLANVEVEGEIFYDGRFETTVKVNVLELGGFTLGQAVITFGNNHPDKEFILDIHAFAGIGDLGPSVKLDGSFHDNGYYELTGTESIELGGLSLSETEFTLKKGEGFKYKAKWDYGVFYASIEGSIGTDFRAQFTGTGGGKLAGFDLGTVNVDVDLNPAIGHFSIEVGVHVNLLGTQYDLSASLSKNAGSWQALAFDKTIAIPSPLSALISSSAHLKFDKDGAVFDTSFSSPFLSASFQAHAAINSDGSIAINGTATLPLLGSAKLDGHVGKNGTDYSFTAMLLDNWSMGSWGKGLFPQFSATLDNLNGVRVTGSVNLPAGLVGGTFSGTIAPNGNFSIGVQLGGSPTLGSWGDKVSVNATVTLTNTNVSVGGSISLPSGLLESTFLGEVGTDGSFSFEIGLKAGSLLGSWTKSQVTLNATAKLTNTSVEVHGAVELPGGLLKGSFSGRVFTNGTFDITVAFNANASLGSWSSSQVSVGLSAKLTNNSVSLSGNVSLPGGLADGSFSGTVSTNGTFDITVTLNASPKFGSWTKSQVAISTSARLTNTSVSLSGSVNLPGGVLKGSLSGTVSTNGTFDLTVTLNAGSLLGSWSKSQVSLSASAKLTNTSLTVGGSVNLPANLSTGTFSGTVSTTGALDVSVTLNASPKLGSWTRSQVAVSASARLTNSSVTVSGAVDLPAKLGKGTFSGTITTYGSFNISVKLDAGRSLGSWAGDVSVSASATLTEKSVSVSGSVSLPAGLGSAKFSGTVATNGYFSFNINLKGPSLGSWSKSIVSVNTSATLSSSGVDISGGLSLGPINASFSAYVSRSGTFSIDVGLKSVNAGIGKLSAYFTLSSSSLTFSGSLKLPYINKSYSVSGSVNTDGSFNFAGLSGSFANNPALNQLVKLWRFVGASFSNVASALWNGGALAGKYPLDLAKALINGGNADAWDIANALENAGIGFRDIAYALGGSIGGINLGDIASALWDETKASFVQVTDALWNSGVANFFSGGFNTRNVVNALSKAGADLYDIAEALGGGVGGLRLVDIAYAIRNGGIGAGFANIGDALWNSDVSSYFRGGFNGAQFISALSGAGAGLGDLISAVQKAWNYGRSKAVSYLASIGYGGSSGGGGGGILGNLLGINGYPLGAVAYFDVNKNATLDPDEPWAVTDAHGKFSVLVPLEFDLNSNGALDDNEGQWVIEGGTDVTTGAPSPMTLIAPASWKAVTPLTTLVVKLAGSRSLSLADASNRVLTALNLPSVDLSTFDPEAEALAGNATGAKLFGAHARVADTFALIASLFADPAAESPDQAVMSAIEKAIVDRLAASKLDFGDAAQIASLIGTVATSTSHPLSNDLSSGASEIIADANRHVDATTGTGLAFIQQVARIKQVAQTKLASDLWKAASGQTEIATVVAADTGAALSAQFGLAQIRPIITTAAPLVVDADGPTGAQVTFEVQAVDIAGQPLTVTYSHPSGSLFPMGVTTVTATATDSLGNVASDTFTITVLDASGPQLTAPAEQTIEATMTDGALVTLPVITATDLVDPAPVVTYDPPSGFFPLGSTLVTATATDAAGNKSIVTFTITVVDTVAPVITKPADMLVPADGSSGAEVTLPTVTATDAADVNPVVTFDHASGVFPPGITLVTVTAVDASGNTSTQTFRVFVADGSIQGPIIPTLTHIDIDRREGVAIAMTGAAIDAATVGLVSGATYEWSVFKSSSEDETPYAHGTGTSPNFTFTPNDGGAYRIVLTVTGPAGSATIEETILVEEEAPTVVLPNLGTGHEVGKSIQATVSATDPGTADQQAGFTFAWTVTRGGSSVANGTGATIAFTPGVAGTYVLTVTATDKDGTASVPAEATIVVAASSLTPNQRYIVAVYQDLLGRAPDGGGLTYWGNQLDQGVARSTLINLIDHSAEYFSTIIKPAYEKFLGRQPDQGGIDYWIQRMIEGLTDEQLEAGFIGSAEYYQFAGGTDRAWVDAMYTNLLGRLPDQQGQDYWVAQLAAGANRANVAYGFAGSAERMGQNVMSLYNKYLGRGAGQSEIDYWVDQFIHHGQTNEDVVTGFVSSNEYYNRKTST